MNDNLKIALNSLVIFSRMCIVTVIAIITSRVVLDALGASDYGLYNVVGGVVLLLNIINTAMLSTTYRYIAFEVGKKAEGDLNRVFNISFFIHFCFAFALLGIGIFVGDWYINNYLNVDPSKLSDAHFVYYVSLITTAVSTLLIPYQGLIVAFEKFSVIAIIDVLSNIVRFIIIIMFIYCSDNRLRLYSIIMMGTNILASIIYLFYSYYHFSSIVRLKFQRCKSLYKEMLSYAFWTLFGAVAIIGKDQGGKVLVNYFWGTLVNASYAVGTQIEALVQSFARSLSNAAIPQITKNFSGGNSQRSITLTSYISKYTFFLMSLIAYPAIVEIDFLLGLWLVEVPAGSAIFCKLIILNALLSCLGEGIPALVNATGNIKVYQIVYQSFNFLGLPIALLCYILGYNQYSISFVYCAITFLCVFVRLYLLKRIFLFDIKEFVQISYLKIASVSVPLIVVYYIYDSHHFSILQHILGLVCAEFIVILSIIVLGLDKREWNLVKRLYSKKRRNI